MWDRLIIAGGLVVDGTGREPFTADVVVEEGEIVHVGRATGPADRVIDADGALVTPGWVDVHTHYDGHVLWDRHVSPSSGLGVTTVVVGNSGVGFAPARARERGLLVELMHGVGHIPATVLDAGLVWNWESHGEYLDAVDQVPHDVEVGALLPHAALRLYVMGERGADHTERASPEEVEHMAELARDSVLAGALGFSTSRSENHKSSGGEVIGTRTAPAEELVPIAAAIGSTGRGVFHLSGLGEDVDADFALMRKLAEASAGRPLTFSLRQDPFHSLNHRKVLERLASAREQGLAITAQVAPRPIGSVAGLECSSHPFVRQTSFERIQSGSLAELVALLRCDGVRDLVLQEYRSCTSRESAYPFDRMFPMASVPDYRPHPDSSVAARAAKIGCSPEELAYQLMLEDDGEAKFFVPHMSRDDGGDSMIEDMLTVPGTILGGAGADMDFSSDSSFPTDLLAYWCRDRGGGTLDVADAVRRATSAAAAAVGLDDRGVVAPGYRADLNVIDHQRLLLRRPDVVDDLPAGGHRLLQRADGYLHTFVAGVETQRDGEPTGALPGRLVRGCRMAGVR